MKAYEYLVIRQPKEKDGEVVDEGAIVVGVNTVLAKDEAQAQLRAARAIPDAEMDNLDRLEVVVRPF